MDVKVKTTVPSASIYTMQGRKSAEPYRFSDLRIAVITNRDDRSEQLIRELQKTRADV